MFNKNINYKSVAYSISKGFIDEEKAKFYLYWEDKIENINMSNMSIVDKVFILMCQNQRIGWIPHELEHCYEINIEEDEVYKILINCQCFDIEITVMAKSFLYYQFPGTKGLEEQIYYIMKYGNIDLPYTYESYK